MITPSPIDGALLDKALSLIESNEYASLVWGSVDGGFSREQLIKDLATLFIPLGSVDPEEDAEELLEELISRALVCECATLYGENVFRSRFAEGVRLFSKLRQLFPRRNWRTAKSLVADFRVDYRPRRYPSRNINPEELREQIEQTVSLAPIALSVWNAIIPPGMNFKLSGFQARSAKALLEGNRRGAIVTAGTGSGKTLAFYLPALVSLAEQVLPGKYWTKCLAVYPRIELLKDQFAETLDICSRINPVLKANGRRPLIIGTMFGDTPYDAGNASQHWFRSNSQAGVICPYTKCPAKTTEHGTCGGNMLWLDADRDLGKERLVCESCGSSVDNSTIILTRKRALTTPPDILFTTMEMTHKRIADPAYHKLLGIGKRALGKISLVLLDEVHTYSGMAGAQSSMVIKRWKHATGASPFFVGLSATLRDAGQFFAQLAGLQDHQVVAIGAREDEMIDEGAEYQLVLRGDATSQSSLLSTSIQSAMLMPRLLDPVGISRSEGLFGMRTFAFTDDLDVNTRFYDDLCDAEGIRGQGGRTATLAGLRGPTDNESQPILKEVAGQRWRLPERIGHTLSHPLNLGRTSSRDPGVASRTNLIVATASLEVGYNDGQVGAVMQHKAPMDMASFLQRKGRAGRPRGMRPWTVTVLSAFGRDRTAFHNYDQLFDPTLDRRHLPTSNLYLIRMQAVAAFFDWLGLQWAGMGKYGWVWRILSNPDDAAKNQEFCNFTMQTVHALLNGNHDRMVSLKTHLAQALDLNDKTVEGLLYAPPRALLLEVLPTLQRRLTSRWKLADGSGYESWTTRLPLPEFVAPNLFTNLALPEVQLDIERAENPESVPLHKALKEAVPGRVTRRFAEHDATLSHWVDLDIEGLVKAYREANGGLVHLLYPLDRFVIGKAIGHFPMLNGQDVPVIRPLRMRLSRKATPRVLNVSNARPIWHSHIFTDNSAADFRPAKRSKWQRLVPEVNCYLHAHNSSVTVRRFTTGAHANMSINRERIRADISYQDAVGQPTALGFEFETDGLAVRYVLPKSDTLLQQSMSQALRGAAHRAFFRDQALQDPELRQLADHFQIDWLQQVYLTTMIAWATRADTDLKTAHDAIRTRRDIKAMKRAMKVVIGLQQELGMEDQEVALASTLSDLLEQHEILCRLHDLGTLAYAPPPERFGPWLREKTHLSMVNAVHYSCMQNVPRYATMSTLLADPGPIEEDNDKAVIWITEDSLGGSGVMEALVRRFMERPTLLFSGIEAGVALSGQEQTNEILERIVRCMSEDEELQDAVMAMRTSILHQDRSKARVEIERVLLKRGVSLSKAASVGLNARLLRPGTQAETDELIVTLIDTWDTLQERLGIALDLQEFCALIALDDTLRAKIRNIAPPGAEFDGVALEAQLAGILWPNGQEVRRHSLNVYNPYLDHDKWTDPLLIRELLLHQAYVDVRLDDPDWLEKTLTSLGRSETCRLLAPAGIQDNLAEAMTILLAQPVDVGYLQFFPILERIEQDARHVAAVFSLWEEI